MFHELKILPEHFEPVLAGVKLAELRMNDRNFKVDDILCLREYENGEYTGRKVYRHIIHVADVSAYLPGYVLLSMEAGMED